MATFSAVSRQHILQAIAEYDERGGENFLGVYGFGPSLEYWLVHEGRQYDSKAILGVAHKYATGRVAPADEFSGGVAGAAAVLRKNGFEVTGPATPASPAPARRAAAGRTTSPRTPRTTSPRSSRRVAPEDRPVAICPTCFTVLPATGICDTCG